uniref:Regulatory protein zeste n=1 Tax=Romanomermis culicivorax TaxID=13658 RepID=A0A915KQY9_ROMCU
MEQEKFATMELLETYRQSSLQLVKKTEKRAWEEITSSLNATFPEAVHDVKNSAKKWSNLKRSAEKATHDQKKIDYF